MGGVIFQDSKYFCITDATGKSRVSGGNEKLRYDMRGVVDSCEASRQVASREDHERVGPDT
jgi:hypothetical protein